MMLDFSLIILFKGQALKIHQKNDIISKNTNKENIKCQEDQE